MRSRTTIVGRQNSACLNFLIMPRRSRIYRCKRVFERVSDSFINKIISDKHLKMREDLLCFTRILNVVAHYEAGFDYHLENHLRETYKYLIKMDDLHTVQKAMMRFVRSLGDIYPHELKAAFVKLHKELKQYEEDPYERRAFLYLDILSWLESKIENRSIGEIIREKAKVINRKERNSIRV